MCYQLSLKNADALCHCMWLHHCNTVIGRCEHSILSLLSPGDTREGAIAAGQMLHCLAIACRMMIKVTYQWDQQHNPSHVRIQGDQQLQSG